MDKEFLTKLKATLDAMLEQNKVLSERVVALEHTVNDVIIGGLTSAADEYEDNERFSEFVDTYSEAYSPFGDTCKVLFGDDYDIAEELYAGSRDKENVKAYVEEEIAKLQSKLDALKTMTSTSTEEQSDEQPKEVEVSLESSDEPKEDFDEEELVRIAKEML